jgi:hypothetical protein
MSDAARPARRPVQGLKVVGLFSADERDRRLRQACAFAALEALDIPVEKVDVATSGGLDFTAGLDRPTSAAPGIFHLNPAELLAALAILGPARWSGPATASGPGSCPRRQPRG